MDLVAALQQADDRTAPYLDLIDQVQAAFFQQHGRYAQALPISSAIPEDGGLADADQTDMAPTDQALAWRDFTDQLPAQVASQVAVASYHAPDGHGYMIIQRLRYGGSLYEKVIIRGPIQAMNADWTKVDNGWQ